MGVLASIVLDCADREALAPFWAEVLGYVRRDDVATFAVLTPPDGGEGPILLLQQVGEPRQGKNRMHIDITADDVDVEAERLMAIGALQCGEGHIGHHRWLVMADPEGNEFCIAAKG